MPETQQNTPILIARDHLKLVERLEAKCDQLLFEFSNAGADHVDQVAEDWPELLPEYMALTDLFSDCVAYGDKHNTLTPTDYTGAL